ncbi:hypothetical protein RI367_002202 [Sorochytrium milnesiophthora]
MSSSPSPSLPPPYSQSVPCEPRTASSSSSADQSLSVATAARTISVNVRCESLIATCVQPIPIEMPETASAADLKRAVRSKMVGTCVQEVSVQDMTLIFIGRRLRDQELLQDVVSKCRDNEWHTFHLVLRSFVPLQPQVDSSKGKEPSATSAAQPQKPVINSTGADAYASQQALFNTYYHAYYQYYLQAYMAQALQQTSPSQWSDQQVAAAFAARPAPFVAPATVLPQPPLQQQPQPQPPPQAQAQAQAQQPALQRVGALDQQHFLQAFRLTMSLTGSLLKLTLFWYLFTQNLAPQKRAVIYALMFVGFLYQRGLLRIPQWLQPAPAAPNAPAPAAATPAQDASAAAPPAPEARNASTVLRDVHRVFFTFFRSIVPGAIPEDPATLAQAMINAQDAAEVDNANVGMW